MCLLSLCNSKATEEESLIFDYWELDAHFMWLVNVTSEKYFFQAYCKQKNFLPGDGFFPPLESFERL